MKVINYKDYNPSMGTLIDIRDPLSAKEKPFSNSTNIYYEKLLMNYKTLLDKNKRYYIKRTVFLIFSKIARFINKYT